MCVLVGNVQAHDFLPLELRAETLRQLVPVRLFHHENDISPDDLLGRQRCFGVVVQPRRIDFQAGDGREHLLCSGTAESIL